MRDLGKQIIPLDQSISFEIDCNGEPGNQFYSDAKRLKIIFNNLLSNAVNFRDTTKAQCQIQISIQVTKEGAAIQFEDNGIGIEAIHIDKIFQMFYRATEHGTGSGLGLYIVNEVLLKLGGSIKVQSQPNQFTRFSLWIPSAV